MQIHYLEIVCPNPKETSQTLSAIHNVTFEEPNELFGNAYMAKMPNGSRIGIRASMHESEVPVTRPYFLCPDIKSAIKTLEASGALIMHPPLEMPGEGTFAIYMENDIQYGLWEI